MKLTRTFFFVTGMLSIFSCGTQHISRQDHSPSNIFSNEQVGIWEIPQEQRSVWGDGTITLASLDIFKYDGTYITMRWSAMTWTPYSADGFYKLKTKWKNDTLLYLSPASQWEEIWEKAAVYKNGIYTSSTIVNGATIQWTFRKISSAEVIERDKAVLAERKLYEYSIK